MFFASLVAAFVSMQSVSFSPTTAQFHPFPRPRPVVPDAYAVDFVATAARGIAMNRAGDVAGTAYLDTGCGSFCLPPQETVVWSGGNRFVLPSVPGLTGIYVKDINRDGWVVGLAGYPYTATHAVVWIPSGGNYQAIDLGTLPGTNTSEATGIDDQGRVVGWSTTTSFPPNGSPFVWTLGGGMVDLSAVGFPDEMPMAISDGGTVATVTSWYRLGDPSSVHPIATPPTGYVHNAGSVAVNDAGDQGRFLVRTSGQNLVYLYRYHHEGSWQPLSAAPTGHLSSYGIGSIDAFRTVTATVQGTGVIAFGPEGSAQSLASLVSTAYPEATVGWGGPTDASGAVLTQVMIGRSQRVARLVPVSTCAGACMRVGNMTVTADFVPDPSDPTQDHCSPTLNAHNEALVTVTVTDPSGFPIAGAIVSGRFLDDYWTDDAVVQTTNGNGVATFRYTGLCGVGAIAFLVDDVNQSGATLDRTVGVLTGWTIPN